MCEMSALSITQPPQPQGHDPPPDGAEVRAALEQVTQSNHFRASLRLTAFLRFVVERTLAGRLKEIKGYTIAVEAFGRDPSFEPDTDPIVRVEAARLRRALAAYYAGRGRADRTIIDMPRGSYVPRFRRPVEARIPESSDRAVIRILLDRLVELQRQLEYLTIEMERAWVDAEHAGQPVSRRD
jgi:hypothetical protein